LVAPWILGVRGRATPQRSARGALVGLFGGLVWVVATNYETRAIQHDDVLPLAIMMFNVVMPVLATILGVLCAAIALGAFWVRRRGERVPF